MNLKCPFILTIAIFIISCNVKKGNFSVTAPKGWLKIDTVQENGRRFVKMHPLFHSDIPIFIRNINIGIMKGSNIDYSAKQVIDEIKKDAFAFKEEGKGVVKINKYDVRWEQHIIQLHKTDDMVEQKVFFIGDNGNIYQVVCSTTPNDIQKMEPEIEEVLNSFKVL